MAMTAAAAGCRHGDANHNSPREHQGNLIFSFHPPSPPGMILRFVPRRPSSCAARPKTTTYVARNSQGETQSIDGLLVATRAPITEVSTRSGQSVGSGNEPDLPSGFDSRGARSDAPPPGNRVAIFYADQVSRQERGDQVCPNPPRTWQRVPGGGVKRSG